MSNGLKTALGVTTKSSVGEKFIAGSSLDAKKNAELLASIKKDLGRADRYLKSATAGYDRAGISKSQIAKSFSDWKTFGKRAIDALSLKANDLGFAIQGSREACQSISLAEDNLLKVEHVKSTLSADMLASFKALSASAKSLHDKASATPMGFLLGGSYDSFAKALTSAGR